MIELVKATLEKEFTHTQVNKQPGKLEFEKEAKASPAAICPACTESLESSRGEPELEGLNLQRSWKRHGAFVIL